MPRSKPSRKPRLGLPARSQLAVLAVLAKVGRPLALDVLAELAGIKLRSVYTITQRLRRAGYIENELAERRGGGDTVYTVAQLTAKGRRFVAAWRAFLAALEG